MNVMYVFALGATAAVFLSLATVLVLRSHLARLLEELCGSGARAGFWTVTSVLWIFLVGILAGTVDSGYGAGKDLGAEVLFFGLVVQVRACLIGLLAGVLVVAWVLLGFVRRFEQGLMPAAPMEPPRFEMEPGCL